jgi:hypothetical protein
MGRPGLQIAVSIGRKAWPPPIALDLLLFVDAIRAGLGSNRNMHCLGPATYVAVLLTLTDVEAIELSASWRVGGSVLLYRIPGEWSLS